jgi:hypothetical protein
VVPEERTEASCHGGRRGPRLTLHDGTNGTKQAVLALEAVDGERALRAVAHAGSWVEQRGHFLTARVIIADHR